MARSQATFFVVKAVREAVYTNFWAGSVIPFAIWDTTGRRHDYSLLEVVVSFAQY